eukprot:CAMPEP_0170311880 /NCGR_PEP_ID=MMETSP0116_2-20130129/56457_1 /TAXON_ID=400756 /ORGANISM="Durinskia baltica, Strain CSIRO CS-38" /LENGTH=47 /DNA_ID= /DNA_START= /DNA_END= /DNA_ORIENTATION=
MIARMTGCKHAPGVSSGNRVCSRVQGTYIKAGDGVRERAEGAKPRPG